MKSRDILPLEDRTLKALSEYGMNRLLMKYSEALTAAEQEFIDFVNQSIEDHKVSSETYGELAVDIERLSNLHATEQITSSKFRELVMKLLENSSKVRYEESMKRYREGCTDIESLINQAAHGKLVANF